MEQNSMPVVWPMNFCGHPMESIHPFLDDPAMGPGGEGAGEPKADVGAYKGDAGETKGG
jgi:hypothetical protein